MFRSRTLRRTLAAALLAGCLSATAQARQADPAPTTAAAGERSIQATITAIEGLVQVRPDGQSPWQKAQVGMELGEKAEFRTGPKSAVRFEMPGGHVVTVDRLGVAKLLQAVTDDQKMRTKIGMKYGRTRYDIESVGLQNESSIVSPSTTLAIRGTQVSLYDQRPFRPEAVSLTGRAQFRDLKKQVSFGGKNQGRTRVTTEQSSAAATALSSAVVDPTLASARSRAEAGLISTLLSRGATVSFDRQSDLKVVSGGTPPTDAQLSAVVPGTLAFVVRWNGNSNIDLGVSSPGGANAGGEFLYPATGANTNASGGKIPFDHRGGPNGGIEIAFWAGSYPKGLYGLGLVLASGGTTNAVVQAFLNGKPLKIFDGQELVTKVTVSVFPLAPGLGEGTLGGIVPVGTELPRGQNTFGQESQARLDRAAPLKANTPMVSQPKADKSGPKVNVPSRSTVKAPKAPKGRK